MFCSLPYLHGIELNIYVAVQLFWPCSAPNLKDCSWFTYICHHSDFVEVNYVYHTVGHNRAVTYWVYWHYNYSQRTTAALA